MRGSTIGEGGVTTIVSRVGHQNSPFPGLDYMIPYMVGKLALNSSYLTRGLVKSIPGRGCFRDVSSQNGNNFVTSPPSPNR